MDKFKVILCSSHAGSAAVGGSLKYTIAEKDLPFPGSCIVSSQSLYDPAVWCFDLQKTYLGLAKGVLKLNGVCDSETWITKVA